VCVFCLPLYDLLVITGYPTKLLNHLTMVLLWPALACCLLDTRVLYEISNYNSGLIITCCREIPICLCTTRPSPLAGEQRAAIGVEQAAGSMSDQLARDVCVAHAAAGDAGAAGRVELS
jgi:hypothetical protein